MRYSGEKQARNGRPGFIHPLLRAEQARNGRPGFIHPLLRAEQARNGRPGIYPRQQDTTAGQGF